MNKYRILTAALSSKTPGGMPSFLVVFCLPPFSFPPPLSYICRGGGGWVGHPTPLE